MNIPVLKTMSALVLSTLAFGGLAQTKGVTPAEMNYQAGGSTLANEPMYQSSNPKAPPMTQAEFDLARKIYFLMLRTPPLISFTDEKNQPGFVRRLFVEHFWCCNGDGFVRDG